MNRLLGWIVGGALIAVLIAVPVALAAGALLAAIGASSLLPLVFPMTSTVVVLAVGVLGLRAWFRARRNGR